MKQTQTQMYLTAGIEIQRPMVEGSQLDEAQTRLLDRSNEQTRQTSSRTLQFVRLERHGRVHRT